VLDLLASGTEAVTAAIWPFEVANALLMGERRKRISLPQVTTVLQRISALPIAVDPIRTYTAFGQILSVARQELLTEYDATYLELALREGLPLATLDAGLRRGARNAGVGLVTI
jgi:predicted nucleic acid-binding protein